MVSVLCSPEINLPKTGVLASGILRLPHKKSKLPRCSDDVRCNYDKNVKICICGADSNSITFGCPVCLSVRLSVCPCTACSGWQWDGVGGWDGPEAEQNMKIENDKKLVPFETRYAHYT